MESVRVGLLHSQTGTMAFSESPLLDAGLLAIDKINKNGGVLGCRIVPEVEDGASDPDLFSEKARKLIAEKQVTTIFGGWNSHARKAVKQVVEEHGALFWYPMQYEGLEESPNVFYTGSCLNQQIQPALDWCWDMGWRDYCLIGSDYIFPITANMLMKSILKYKGGNVVGETYLPLGHADFSAVFTELSNRKPHVIINTLNGDCNVCFFRQYEEFGLRPSQLPVLSTSVAEHESRQIGSSITGHFACWNYFQSLDSRENREFVALFRRQYGEDRVVSDPIVMAYTQLFMWKQLVEAASSFDVDKIRKNAAGQGFETPAGHMTLMPNHHLAKPHMFIGKAVCPGEFEIVWRNRTNSQPLPWHGVEVLSFPSSHLVKDVMKAFPDTLSFNAELEQQVRKRTRELADSQQRLQGVFETMMEGVVVISPDGSIVQANAEAERILGLARKDILKRHFMSSGWNAVRQDGTPMPHEETAAYRALHEMRPVRDVVMGIVRDDRSVCWINVCATPFINDERKLEAVIVTFSNTTERKRMWDELQKTQRLESLGVLAGGIAHDFNNLLGGIFGNIDLAMEVLDDQDKVREFLENGMSALERAKDLTRQLLTFSKGGNPIKVTFPVEPLLRESLSLSLSGSSIAREVYIEPGIRELDADPNQISQVLNNIILNARQAMSDGGKLTISIGEKYLFDGEISRLGEGDYLEISIRDNGAGIPNAEIPKIFDPFFTTRFEGTGLGLSMCHSIVCRHNGAITVDSVEGVGTAFNIYLPVARSDYHVEGTVYRHERPQPGRILVMDDEDIQRDVIMDILREAGCTVMCVADGEEAVVRFRENMINGTPFDLVILDLTVQGGMGGVRTMAELRKLDPEITGIVASGYSDSMVLENPADYQFAGKIGKPFRKAELVHVVANVIKKVRRL